MIKESEIEIKGHSSNYIYYRELGYYVEIRKPFIVKTIHLMRGSTVKITCICDNCGKETKNVFKDYWNYTNGLKDPYFCVSCKTIKSEVTSLEKYGTRNPMQSDKIKDRLKESLLEKYGVDHYSKTEEWLEKYKKTSLEKYGVDNIFKSDKLKELSKKWMSSDKFNKKSKETILIKYGVDHYSKTDEYKEKSEETCNDKYGVSNYSKTKEYLDKVNHTNYERYGGHPSKTDNFKKSIKGIRERKTYKKYSELISEKYESISYKDELFELVHKDCGEKINIQRGLLYIRYKLDKMICTVCNPIGVYVSEFENEVCRYLDECNIQYIRNDKNILNGLELDIYIPDHNIAIEVNGIYWHSELFKRSNYHINKTLKCKEIGINLLHIWEDDWAYKREIIKSIIRNRLGLIDNKIYARKCEIRKVNTKEYKKFLCENHIQGYCSSSINIGLYYNNELISLMTFGFRKTNNKKEYELIRFCNKLNTNVIGGSSKLFKYFLSNYEYVDIISYADISLFTGELYKKLEFISNGLSEPNYFWVGSDNIRKHRYNFSKRKLVNKGYDKDKTEVEIMHERGYYRVYSCGQERYVYSKNILK